MVARTTPRLPRPWHLPGLRQLGRLPKRLLHHRALHLPLLLPGNLRLLAPRLVRPQALLVPLLSTLLPRPLRPLDPGALSLHLLLLPGRLLQILLGRSARLRRLRTPQDLPGREELSAHHAEPPSPL